MAEEVLGRAEFFRQLFKKSAGVVLQMTDNLLESLEEAGNWVPEDISEPLLPVDRYDGSPALITSSKPPVFLVGEPGKNLRAVSALCPKDGFLLTYLAAQEALYCSMCDKSFPLKGNEQSEQKELAVYPVRVRNNFFYLIRK